jgi:hypothetical protein
MTCPYPRMSSIIPRTSVLTASLIALILTGCAQVQFAACPADLNAMRSETLYFGSNKPGGTVSDEEWRRFLAESVTPRFPRGLTAWQAQGQWRGASGAIEQEHSHVLSIIHSGSVADEQALAGIVTTYKRLFRQEAVLRVSTGVCVSL